MLTKNGMREITSLLPTDYHMVCCSYPEVANGGTQFSAITTIFSAKYQLTIVFLANSQLTTNFGSY